jgi:hypothetical protein
MGHPRDRYRDYVEHPLYGRCPRITGQNPQDDWENGIYLGWHSPIGERIADTAITADTSKQVSRPVPVTHYYDVKRLCRDCKRLFLFFAEEQKFWYETLGFPLESDCVRCIDCRKTQQEYAEQRQTYERLLPRTDRSDKETLELATCALTLIECGVFGTRTIERVRSFLNSIPNDSIVRDRGQFRDLTQRVARLAGNTG